MEIDIIKPVGSIRGGYDKTVIEQDDSIENSPLKAVGPGKFLVGRPYWKEAWGIEVKEGEIYSQPPEGRKLSDPFYIKGGDDVIQVKSSPVISKTEKFDWPDMKDDDGVPIEKKAWNAFVDDLDKYDYVIAVD